jgi:hypothetical protein
MGTSSSAREREALGLLYVKSSCPSFPSDEYGRFLLRPANHQIHALHLLFFLYFLAALIQRLGTLKLQR